MAAARVTRLSASVLKVLGHNALSTESSPSPFGPDLMYIIGGKASRILIDAGEEVVAAVGGARAVVEAAGGRGDLHLGGGGR